MGVFIKEKEKARKLRAKGKTFSEIRKAIGLSIPKSTLSNWCSDVKLPNWYQDKLSKLTAESLSKANKVSLVSNQIKQQKLLKEIEERNKDIAKKVCNKETLRVLLAILYLGEGAKWKSHRGLMLGSSDPNIINLYIKLLNKCYGIKIESLRCRISYRDDQDINKLQKFWSRTTGIPISNFYKTKPDPRTIGKKTKNKDYKGVCVITCAGTKIQLELEKIPEIILRAVSSVG